MSSAYALQSTREHGAYVACYDRTPKLFSSRLAAWWFKARRGKWHWKVIRHDDMALMRIVGIQDIH